MSYQQFPPPPPPPPPGGSQNNSYNRQQQSVPSYGRPQQPAMMQPYGLQPPPQPQHAPPLNQQQQLRPGFSAPQPLAPPTQQTGGFARPPPTKTSFQPLGLGGAPAPAQNQEKALFESARGPPAFRATPPQADVSSRFGNMSLGPPPTAPGQAAQPRPLFEHGQHAVGQPVGPRPPVAQQFVGPSRKAPPPTFQPTREAAPSQASSVSAVLDLASRCDPRYMRCTVGQLPNSAATALQTRLPVGVICQPMALDTDHVAPLDVINFGSTGIVRCKKCRAYVNPYVSWVNNGRQWRCNVCGFVNEVPNSYFCQLDPETGQRRDVEQRPELRNGSVELVAPGEYMVRPPQPPVYVVLLDVSPNAVASGMVDVVAKTILDTLDALPGTPRTQFALLTFDSTVHFYSLKASLTQPHMVCVADLADLFVPLPDDLLVNLAESREVIATLLETLPSMHSRQTQTQQPHHGGLALGPALVAAYRVMGHIGGKLCVFCSGLPSAGEGALQPRDSARAYGTDQERMLLKPAPEAAGRDGTASEASWYETKAVEFSRLQIGVELFVTSSSYSDVATLGVLPKITAGQLYHYPGFRAERDGDKLSRELQRAISRPTGFEAVMRVRCTRGLRVSAFRGNFYIRGHDLLALPNCHPESVFALELTHDDQPLSTAVASVQASLLYTSSSGERRIRVHTMVLPVAHSAAEVVASADVDALVNVLAKSAVNVGLKDGLDAARAKLQQKCVEIVSACRSTSASPYGARPAYGALPPTTQPGAPGTFKLPESLQLLPLYTMSLLKSSAFRGGSDVNADDRSFVLQKVDNMAPEQTRYYVYPRLLPIHLALTEHRPSNQDDLPQPCNLSNDSIASDGIYLLDNSLSLSLWVGANARPDLLDALFQVDETSQTADLKLRTDAEDTAAGNPYLDRLNRIIAQLTSSRPPYLQVTVTREGDPHKQPLFFRHLVEDHANFPGGQFSYQEFMAHVQRHS